MKDECYEFIKNEIGKTNIVGFGSYGQVKIARNTDNSQIVAIKLIHGKNAKQEIDVHHKLNHPNIIKLLNYYYQKQKNITYMVLQYAQNGTLNEKIKFGLGQLSKQLIRRYFRDICEAIKYLHKHNYMHRDIKPQNILITKDNTAKLCDFGFAAIFEARTTMCGTFEYMAPQMIKKKHYSYKIDIWALGILLFEMIQGIAPFRGQTGEQVIAQMKKPIKFSSRFDSCEIDLIKKILRVNSENRPTVQDILEHPYFKTLKQDEKSSTTRNTIQMQSKLTKVQQQPFFIKEKTTSSTQELTRFLKNSNEKLSSKVQNPIQVKKRMPFSYSYLKTQPTQTEVYNGNNNNMNQSFRTKNQLNEEHDGSNSKTQTFRKYTMNFSSSNAPGTHQNYSPHTQKKTKSPVNSKTETKDNYNANLDTSLRTQKKTSINTALFANNFNSSSKTLNSNKNKNEEPQISKKISITGKFQHQKSNPSSSGSALQFLNKSFKNLKTSNQMIETSLKLNSNFPTQPKPQITGYANVNAIKKPPMALSSVNTSFKYPKSGSPQYENISTSMNSYQQNYQARKYPQETGFSYNQIYNLQKSANVGSPNKQSNLHKLKQSFK